MPVLLWVGVLCVCFRQLHQTSSLAVGVMEESYRESLECTDEDITDKVRASFPSSLLPCRQDKADFVLVLLGFPGVLRGRDYRTRWEQHCPCYPAGFSALQCSHVPRQDQAGAPRRWDRGSPSSWRGWRRRALQVLGWVRRWHWLLLRGQRLPPKCWEQEWAVHRQRFHFSCTQEDVLEFCFSEPTHPV